MTIKHLISDLKDGPQAKGVQLQKGREIQTFQPLTEETPCNF